MPDQFKINYILSGILIILYLVGIYGFAVEWDYLIALTPLQLMISAVCIVYSQAKEYRSQILGFGLVAYSGSFLIECIGVNTGFPFGIYTYHEVLGPKVYYTPLIIGVNWFILLLASRSITQKVYRGKRTIPTVIISSLLMVGLDFLIEPIAVHYRFWSWSDETIPPDNYISWFIIAIILQLLFRKMVPKYSNLCADVLFLLQVLFFGSLNLILLFT